MAECPNIKCYKVRVETPFSIMQFTETTWAALPKKEYVNKVKEDWDEFGRRHNVDVKLEIEEVPCSEVPRIRRFSKQKRRK